MIHPRLAKENSLEPPPRGDVRDGGSHEKIWSLRAGQRPVLTGERSRYADYAGGS